MVTVALDAMGGDHAPVEQVAGAAMASLDKHGPHILLVGDVARLQEELKKHPHAPEKFSFEMAREVAAVAAASAAATTSRPPRRMLRTRTEH